MSHAPIDKIHLPPDDPPANQGAIRKEKSSSTNRINFKLFDRCTIKNAKQDVRELDKEHQEPPNDFRKISVYPTPEELHSDSMSFLRENVIEGPYRDVNHYLDVQFRLLREDFISPLRKGIQGYVSNLKNGTNERLDSVAIYKKVRFLSSELVNKDYCYRIEFNPSQQPTNKNSKSFMTGSLLCFTRSSSFLPLLFGKVASHDRRELTLRRGELIVAFTSPVDISFSSDYLMLESRAFFEPYFHVLTQLQRMSSEHFPLEKYIVKVDPNVKSVEYSRRITALSTDFGKNLNDSQKVALRAALSREIAIIQGPPGTGKTHLAKLIVNAFVRHSSMWYARSPILVICFTNQALDQFLEGISSFTKKLIRVGGQSKSKVLEEFNLRNIRKRRHVQEARLDYRVLLTAIATWKTELDYINSVKGIVVLGEIYKDVEVLQSTKILNWLGGYGLKNNESDDEDDECHIPDLSLSKSIFIKEFKKIRCSIFDADLNRRQIAALEQEKHNLSDVDTLKQEKPNIFRKVKVLSKEDRLKEIEAELLLRQEFDTRFYEILETLRESDAITLIGRIPKKITCVSLNDRWNFYFYHLNKYKDSITRTIDKLTIEFRESYETFTQLKDAEDARNLKQALVVGMTTTCAARMKSVLEVLKSPIVIVEEAAEVLEAHIISTLTKHCKHLILIGDHQQLKPSTADYSIEKKFKLGTSLFERMVINKIECFTLNVQHRMKPEISALIAPTIYPNLENHKSVTKRDAIRGVNRSLFFIDHRNRENSATTGTSKSNIHEVYFLLSLARYFLLNGYQPKNITILVTYLEQMNKMENERDKHSGRLKKVRVAVLDNYQGEQSDIILLSLVRSNAAGKIGFLANENRICVALSRARDGLFIIGNMAQLSQASKTWRKIHTTLKDGNNIGPALELQCGNHPERKTFVKESKDFLKAPEGGCDLLCNFELKCGHNCTKFCHVLDPEHEKFKCKKNCERLLCDKNDEHICKKLCFDECGKCNYIVEKKLKCGHTISMKCHEDSSDFSCDVLVPTTLRCGHTVNKPCHSSSLFFPCPIVCKKELPCEHACLWKCHVRTHPNSHNTCTEPCKLIAKGCRRSKEKHLCRKLCYEKCDDLCRIPVRKRRTICFHISTVECHVNVNGLKCEEQCKKTLSCVHECRLLCHQTCQCDQEVIKTLPCNHVIRVECSQASERKLCERNCSLTLPCGHNCTKKCNEPCTIYCKALVDSGSHGKLPCFRETIRNKPCREILKCGHPCSGSYDECLKGRMHKQCVKNIENSKSVIQENAEYWTSLVLKYANLKQLYKQKIMSSSEYLKTKWTDIWTQLEVKFQHAQSKAMKTAISFKLTILEQFAEIYEFIINIAWSITRCTLLEECNFLIEMLKCLSNSFITEQEIHDVCNQFILIANKAESLSESEEWSSTLEMKKLEVNLLLVEISN